MIKSLFHLWGRKQWCVHPASTVRHIQRPLRFQLQSSQFPILTDRWKKWICLRAPASPFREVTITILASVDLSSHLYFIGKGLMCSWDDDEEEEWACKHLVVKQSVPVLDIVLQVIDRVLQVLELVLPGLDLVLQVLNLVLQVLDLVLQVLDLASSSGQCCPWCRAASISVFFCGPLWCQPFLLYHLKLDHFDVSMLVVSRETWSLWFFRHRCFFTIGKILSGGLEARSMSKVTP